MYAVQKENGLLLYIYYYDKIVRRWTYVNKNACLRNRNSRVRRFFSTAYPQRQLASEQPTSIRRQKTGDMAMAPKAEIPLYHQNRIVRSATSRRRRASAPKKRSRGSCCTVWNVLLVSPLVLMAFGLGTFLGIELAQAPGGAGTDLHRGGR